MKRGRYSGRAWFFYVLTCTFRFGERYRLCAYQSTSAKATFLICEQNDEGDEDESGKLSWEGDCAGDDKVDEDGNQGKDEEETSEAGGQFGWF